MTIDQQAHDRTRDLLLLPQTGPQTPMGRLLRRFWHPVARSQDVAVGKARALRILGEDLTVYRGQSGRAYLVAGRCAHRLTRLHSGWVDGDDIRCMYHGWKYDGTGQCLEMPAEGPGLARGVKIAGYPVNEYGGLMFAYMGEAPAPEFDLPRKEVFERPDRLYFVRTQAWPCNWYQQIENSMDAVHVSFVHQKGKIGTFGEAVTPAIPELEYLETSAGIRQIATRSPTNVRISDWTFPNNNHIVVPSAFREDPWIDIGVWMVPNDDENTTRFQLYSVPYTSEAGKERITAHFAKYGDYSPADHHDELINQDKYPEEPLLELTNAQDYVAAIGQGAIVDRLSERLGASDAGIAVLRRTFLRELALLQEGKPTKPWMRLAHIDDLPIPAREPRRA